MAGGRELGVRKRRNRWRIAVWVAAALLLLLPLVAMQIADDVTWTVGDFLFAGALILGVGVSFELAVRKTESCAYRAAVGVALAAAFLLVWVNAAVGLIGSPSDGANLMYLGVLAVGIIGVIIARFRPRGMAHALSVTALAQASVALIALVVGLGATEPPGRWGILILNGFFVALFLGSAFLFRRAVLGDSDQGMS